MKKMHIGLLLSLGVLLASCGSSSTPNLQTPQLPKLIQLEGGRAVAGELVVKYRSGTSRALGLRTLEQQTVAGGRLELVQVAAGQEAATLARLRAQANVEYAEPNYWLSTIHHDMVQDRALSQSRISPRSSVPIDPLPYSATVTDPAFTTLAAAFDTNGIDGAPITGSTMLWGLQHMNVAPVWDQGYRGQNVLVAVIDEGTDLDHPDLSANIWTNPNPSNPNCLGEHGFDFIDNDTNPADSGGHGTHVSGTIAAVANGIGLVGAAPEAKILAIRGLGYQGGSVYNLSQALRYAADCGAKVVNNSWGGGGNTAAFRDAISYGVSKGTSYVFSAGNGFGDGNFPSDPAQNAASLPGLIGVGAVGPNNQRMFFSTSGKGVTVVAPGGSIYSTVPVAQSPNDPYAYLQGTSMAAPNVTGVVALLYSANPALTPDQIKEILENTANATVTAQKAQPDYNFGSEYGYGLVDAKAALDYLLKKYPAQSQ